MPENLPSLTKTHKKCKKVFHGSRLQNIPDGKIRVSTDPKIINLPTTNGDALFGIGVYTAMKQSAKNYAEMRGGALFEIDITGKKFFDYRKLKALFAKDKRGDTKLTRMLNSQNEKIRNTAKQVLEEVKIILENFIDFLERKIKYFSEHENISFRSNSHRLRIILNLNLAKLESINSLLLYLESFTNQKLDLLKNITSGIDLGEEIKDENGIKDLNTHHLSLYYFGGFLQELGFDGVIALESADWSVSKNGKPGSNLTYVIFDPNFKGVSAKKLE